jgi:hypothetical protein
MKNKSFLFLSVAFALIMGFSSCSKDENIAPKISSAAVSTDNKTILVTFSEAVYAKADQTGAIDASALTITAPAALTFTYTVTHTAGSTTATVNITITSVIQGTEVFTVKPASATAIYDNEGAAMAATETVESNAVTRSGIMGSWVSEGSNVAPFVGNLF